MSSDHTIASIFRGPGSATAVMTTASSEPANVTLAFADVQAQSERFRRQSAMLFGEALAPGTVVSSLLPNGLCCLLVFLGTALQRCVAAPLNPAMRQGEIEFYLQDAETRVLIVPAAATEDDEGVRAARKLGVSVWSVSWEPDSGIRLAALGGAPVQPPPIKPTDEQSPSARPEDVALLLHTSGTTGRPKAVPLSHANIAQSMANISATYRLTAEDRSFVVMPLFHVHGLIGATLAPLYAGGSIVVPPRFSATHFWHEFVAGAATWYSAVPTIHQILLRHGAPASIPTIRFIRSCSSALAPSVLAELEAAFQAPVLEAYAMTEAAHQMCSNPLPPAVHKPGSVGLPQGVDLAILDDSDAPTALGEVCVRGANVTRGYLNNPEANAKSFTAASHWFRTGDQGYLDNDGYLVLTGRIKELINRGGEKISPLELDAVLLRCPGVAEAVSFAVADDMYGQEVNAAVVPHSGASVSEDHIQSFMKENVAAFKVPKRVFVAESLPRTATGKIQRRVVAEHFAGPQ
ncbi:acetyl-CoA synthetase-like protein [Coemansia reversa NRRL 1564]|uniref:Acetyl-CoA synthetase-like protein n=1 Tax=Coemansia reversa (strain ATCC 12441 / NRRL 1564) TaxID=763665 RepID=A0A2G5BJE4_COERN|nr:acetyl-CoA synthetase-like protein [Coemansia reversa NRRL 1564]|eukprot:PIA19138.1 acetyl-CoA synthetase-like protein [Coemansia reversa NRRL 1564]